MSLTMTHTGLWYLPPIISLCSSVFKDTFSVRISLAILFKISFANSIFFYSSALFSFTFIINIYHYGIYYTFSSLSYVWFLLLLKWPLWGRRSTHISILFCVAGLWSECLAPTSQKRNPNPRRWRDSPGRQESGLTPGFLPTGASFLAAFPASLSLFCPGFRQ